MTLINSLYLSISVNVTYFRHGHDIAEKIVRLEINNSLISIVYQRRGQYVLKVYAFGIADDRSGLKRKKEKTNITILSKQFQKPINNRRRKHNTPTTHIHTTSYFSGNQGLCALAT